MVWFGIQKKPLTWFSSPACNNFWLLEIASISISSLEKGKRKGKKRNFHKVNTLGTFLTDVHLTCWIHGINRTEYSWPMLYYSPHAVGFGSHQLHAHQDSFACVTKSIYATLLL